MLGKLIPNNKRGISFVLFGKCGRLSDGILLVEITIGVSITSPRRLYNISEAPKEIFPPSRVSLILK